jgi:anti-sigma factor RsiW
MTCDDVRAGLAGFHLGALKDPLRADLERHLTACPACVAELLSLKRDAEVAAERPRAHVRASVRRAVARELGLTPPPRRWWDRPLAAGLALAALVVALTTVELIATSTPTAPVGLARRTAP